MNNEQKINELLVNIFNNILEIEQDSLKQGKFKDLSIREMHVIEAIGDIENNSMSEIAKKLNVTVGTLTISVARLEKKGYIHRQKDKFDRRIVLVFLTSSGKLAYKAHAYFHKEMVKSLLVGISLENQELLIRSLGNIKDFIDKKYLNNK